MEPTSCNALDAREVALVEARIRRELPVGATSKLVVDFGCDAAGEANEVVLESGFGHGHDLRLVRLRSAAGGRVLVRRFAWSRDSAPKALTIESAETTEAAFQAMIATSRVALVARPHRVHLRAPDGSIGLGSWSSSSRDVHLSMRIEDEQGRATEGRYTGYESSAEKERTLPILLAAEGATKLVDSLSFAADAETADDRSFVTARFIAAMASSPKWWVRERYIALVAELGAIDAVPALVPLVAQNGDASSARTREAAITAITRLTGWDAREGESGQPRTTDEAARRIVEECVL